MTGKMGQDVGRAEEDEKQGDFLTARRAGPPRLDILREASAVYMEYWKGFQFLISGILATPWSSRVTVIRTPYLLIRSGSMRLVRVTFHITYVLAQTQTLTRTTRSSRS